MQEVNTWMESIIVVALLWRGTMLTSNWFGDGFGVGMRLQSWDLCFVTSRLDLQLVMLLDKWLVALSYAVL